MAAKQFELMAGALPLDFVNTIHEYGAADPREELESYQDLLAFGQQSGAITTRQAKALHKVAQSHPNPAEKVLAEARKSRDALFRMFSAIAGGKSPASSDLYLLNHMLANTMVNVRLEKTGKELHWGWNHKETNLERVLWPIIRSAAELLTSSERYLIRECGSRTCTWMFLDRSKNRSRLWCDMKKCGNRAKWRRYYERHGSSTEDRKGRKG